MTSHPTTIELIEAIAQFIDERARPQLSGRDAYMARVAVNALALVRRELEQGPAAEAAAVQRMTALLNQDGDLETLNDALCDRLAKGELDVASPGVLTHLKATALDQIAIDQPGYSGAKAVRGDA